MPKNGVSAMTHHFLFVNFRYFFAAKFTEVHRNYFISPERNGNPQKATTKFVNVVSLLH